MASRAVPSSPTRATRCCRSSPRCRDCPALAQLELRDFVRSLVPDEEVVPEHLRGVPRCLHRYEPLLRAAFERTSGAPRVQGAVAAVEPAP
ncbi:hypothetical protein JDY09_02655 [Thermoleophilum album]|uniref:hypothetical protein n=1 Tax=Thermoleophilum album TaxID=29539 RepID=UPI00237C7934|nr:hypothetical protein [Thermoleophilum album]WDT94171.1 hypothetical protein JDY09_02655 [Thermoleophilum album]